jgi:hypothetical protein
MSLCRENRCAIGARAPREREFVGDGGVLILLLAPVALRRFLLWASRAALARQHQALDRDATAASKDSARGHDCVVSTIGTAGPSCPGHLQETLDRNHLVRQAIRDRSDNAGLILNQEAHIEAARTPRVRRAWRGGELRERLAECEARAAFGDDR